MATQLSSVLRPKKLSQVIGQPGAVAYVRGMMKKGDAPNLILISGPSGTGKTTLGRIIGSLLTHWSRSPENDPDNDPDIREVEGNVNRTIDDARDVIQYAKYRPSGGHRRVILVDEAQGFVGPAASAFLKATEDPPKHVTYIWCTDQPDKLKTVMIRRAQSIALKALSDDDMHTVVLNTMDAIEMRLGERGREAVAKRIVAMSHGTAGLAVQYVEMVNTAMVGGATPQEALELAVNSAIAVDGFEAALAYLEAVLQNKPLEAIRAIGSGTGDGVLELMNGMLSGCIRKAAGVNPKDGLGWAASKKMNVRADLGTLLDLQARVVAALDIRTKYLVPSDSILYALARDHGGTK